MRLVKAISFFCDFIVKTFSCSNVESSHGNLVWINLVALKCRLRSSAFMLIGFYVCLVRKENLGDMFFRIVSELMSQIADFYKIDPT